MSKITHDFWSNYRTSTATTAPCVLTDGPLYLIISRPSSFCNSYEMKINFNLSLTVFFYLHSSFLTLNSVKGTGPTVCYFCKYGHRRYLFLVLSSIEIGLTLTVCEKKHTLIQTKNVIWNRDILTDRHVQFALNGRILFFRLAKIVMIE